MCLLDGGTFQLERGIVSSLPVTRRNYPEWIPLFYRKELNLNFIFDQVPRRKLYVSIDGYDRNPSNEDQLKEVLFEYGFEMYDLFASDNSYIDFVKADVVVGVSGFALTGLTFCKPGTKRYLS